MDRWLGAALDYIPSWLEFQMRQSEQPGCVIAIAQRGRIVLERAFGHADLVAGTALTPRHRFRVASHSKSSSGGRYRCRSRADSCRGLDVDAPSSWVSRRLRNRPD